MVWTPLKNISQLGLLFPIYGKIENVPNHQPDIINPFITSALTSAPRTFLPGFLRDPLGRLHAGDAQPGHVLMTMWHGAVIDVLKREKHGISMGFLWEFYGISVGFLWDFYGIWMDFEPWMMTALQLKEEQKVVSSVKQAKCSPWKNGSWSMNNE